MENNAYYKAENNQRLNFKEALFLYENADTLDLAKWATKKKESISKKYVYYNINRHINLSNICVADCPLCAFSVKENEKNGFFLSLEDVERKINDSIKNIKDLTEIHIVSSLHPHMEFDYYIKVLEKIKSLMPKVHIQAFTPVEIVYFSKIANMSIRDVLLTLKKAGLNSLPGGGAEVLEDRIREIICPNKASKEEWIETVKTAHQLNIKTNASILYGHIETKEERLKHLFTLRDIQDETKGFNAFISFPFHPKNTKLNFLNKISSVEALRFMAISRLVLDNIPHIKAFWMMLGIDIAQLSLAFGIDDLDGTVYEEKIIHAAGSTTSQRFTEEYIKKIIRETDHIPIKRDSLYNHLTLGE